MEKLSFPCPQTLVADLLEKDRAAKSEGVERVTDTNFAVDPLLPLAKASCLVSTSPAKMAGRSVPAINRSGCAGSQKRLFWKAYELIALAYFAPLLVSLVLFAGVCITDNRVQNCFDMIFSRSHDVKLAAANSALQKRDDSLIRAYNASELLEQGKIEQAEAQYATVVKMTPPYHPYYCSLSLYNARQRIGRGDTSEKTIATLQNAYASLYRSDYSLEEENGTAGCIAEAFILCGQYRRAAVIGQRLPSEARLLFAGRTALEQRDYAAAKIALDQSVRLKDDGNSAHYLPLMYRSLLNLELGKNQEALSDAKEALRIQKLNEPQGGRYASIVLGWTMLANNNPDGAIAMADKALNLCKKGYDPDWNFSTMSAYRLKAEALRQRHKNTQEDHEQTDSAQANKMMAEFKRYHVKFNPLIPERYRDFDS